MTSFSLNARGRIVKNSREQLFEIERNEGKRYRVRISAVD